MSETLEQITVKIGITKMNNENKKFWNIKIPYSGTISIAIESTEKPSSDVYRSYLQSRLFDEGIPTYQTSKAEIEEISEKQFNKIKQNSKRKSNFKSLIDDIIKQGIL